MKKALILTIVTMISGVGCRTSTEAQRVEHSPPAPSQSIERGRMVFMANCNECHPNGEGGLGPVLNNKPAPRFLIKTQVRVGLGAMPAFNQDKISDKELKELVDYIVFLRRER